MNKLHGVEEVVSSVNTIGLYVNPSEFDIESLNELQEFPLTAGTTHKIPVQFNGLDFDDICKELDLEPELVIDEFCKARYTVGSIGFLPGFPYLHGLPERFHRFKRRSIPRIHVPKGSVGIAAEQAGIYPQESPGGWQLIATTPLVIADAKTQFFPISPGDEVKFFAVDADKAYELEGLRLTEYENN